MDKEYTPDQARNAYNNKICPECGGTLKLTNDVQEWTLHLICLSCRNWFDFVASDMGQTLPYLAKV